MTNTVAFERSHHIDIDAAPIDVFNYVTNPQSWPEWIAASHHIDSANRPLAQGETFSEKWFTREEVLLEWVVLACEAPRRWVARTTTSFIGDIVVEYTFEALKDGTRYTRTVRNPARPKAPTAAMIERIDAEAATALGNIKKNVEKRRGA